MAPPAGGVGHGSLFQPVAPLCHALPDFARGLATPKGSLRLIVTSTECFLDVR